MLVKQRAALDETLTDAPMALNNLALTYNPQAGTLDTNANLGELVNQIASDPQTLLCGFLEPGRQERPAVQTSPARCSSARRRSAPGRRTASTFDPTLGGLVEVDAMSAA